MHSSKTFPLGTFGVWLRYGQVTGDLARKIEDLGYGCLWIGGSPRADLTAAETALHATSHLTVATGIVNIWSADAHSVARSFHRLEQKHPGRFLLGLGAGHREVDGPAAAKPYRSLVDYLDVLDDNDVPCERRILAALGERTLALAATRAAGSHPYSVTPSFTARARQALSGQSVLAVEHKVALGETSAVTRALGRAGLRTYLNAG